MTIRKTVYCKTSDPVYDGDNYKGVPISTLKEASATYEAYQDRLQVGTRSTCTGGRVWVPAHHHDKHISRFY